MIQDFKYILFILALAIYTMFSSCQTKTEKESNLSFTKYQYSQKVHLFDNDNYPSFNIDLHISLPSDSIAYDELYQVMANSYFNSSYQVKSSPQKNLENFSQSFIEEYKGFEEDFIADSTDFGASYNWQMITKNKIIYTNDKILSFAVESFFYSGGAHGNTIKTTYVFDFENKKIIHSNELFKPESCTAIIDLQKTALLKDKRNTELIDLEGLHCENNFYLTKDGIYFHYDQYEIASYAEGPIDIFISVEEIKPYLQRLDLLN